MISKSLIKTALLFTAVSLVSCDKDFNEIGTDIIDDDHYGFEKTDIMSIAADVSQTGPVQTDGLAVNPLGVYNNPALGMTTANFVTQVSLASNSLNREFDDSAEIKKVTLYIPYYATLDETDSEGDHTYILDSIYGLESTTLDLKIHESTYFLGELSHNGGQVEAERYYNDLDADIDAVKGPQLNTPGLPPENTAFVFSNKEFKDEEQDEDGEEVITRTPPGMRIELNKAYFTNKILNAPAGSLTNNNVFHNYLRGIYFKVSNPSNPTGVLNMMNFNEGTITIEYTEDEESEQDVEKTPLTLNLIGKSVSLISYQNVPAVPPNRLVVKGGEGFIATIKLFGEDLDNNGTPDQIDEIKANKWLINEANLIFYVDRSVMSPDADPLTHDAPEPQRLYLYDATNNQPIADYLYDNSTAADPKRAKGIYGGILKTDNEFKDAKPEELQRLGLTSAEVNDTIDRGVLYKIRVTNYVRAMILTDSTNVTLGLSVSESIFEAGTQKVKIPFTDDLGTEVKQLPKAGVMNPLGTVLYGPNIPLGDPDYDKRLKLVIYYTKPDQIED